MFLKSFLIFKNGYEKTMLRVRIKGVQIFKLLHIQLL